MIKGAYFPHQGIYSIPLALKKLCLELGVDIKMNDKVETLTAEKKCFPKTEFETIDADVLLSNVDFFTTQKLLGEN